MTGRRDRERKALKVRPNTATYDVGYGKPPQSGRFKPGQSGNPKGRPRGAKNKIPALNEERLKSIILEEAYRTIKVNNGNRQVSVPMAQAIIRSLAVSAAKGSQRAQRLFSELLVTTEREHKQLHDEWLSTAIEYKVGWERELARREQLGIIAPDPLPHPDDIVIDMRTGAVRVKGPMTKEEKAEWDWICGRKAEFQAELTELQQMLRDDPDHEHRGLIEDDIAHAKRILEIIRDAIPD
jgi:hypothetical protein